jgi:S1-C subfamily serine protease
VVFLKRALAAAFATLLLGACSTPAIRLATSTETQQGSHSPAPTSQPGAVASPAPAASPMPGVNPSGTGALSQFQDTLRQLAAAVSPSIVEIETGNGLGSGIIFDGSGDIVTNAHVVEGASSLTVITFDGNRYTANLVGSYAGGDLAVIKVPAADGLRPAQFADSSKVKVGDIVLAIGSPYGLADSVTDGIVSATGRSQSEGNGVVLTDLIQTTAGINPGNSGGALVNISGQVIGMPTLSGVDRQTQNQPSENVGFAIPSNQITTVARQLISSGSVTHTGRPYLGVSSRDSSLGGAQVVSTVSGGAADRAGIQAGWVITAVGGHAVSDSNSLGEVLARYSPGQKVDITVRLPDGSTRTVSVQLGERPANP